MVYKVWVGSGLQSKKELQEIKSRRAVFALAAHTKTGTVQRRLAWPICKDDMQIQEAFYIFLMYGRQQHNIVKRFSSS